MFNPLDDDEFQPSPQPVAANFKPQPGAYRELSNADYHGSEGISKTGLDYIADNPSDYIWHKSSPVDIEKLEALNEGQALHTLILEPHEYNNRFVVEQNFDRRTNAGKADAAAFAEEVAQTGKILLPYDTDRKLHLMRDSVMAHPMARKLLEMDGVNEESLYWIDKETGELCKCRPDRRVDLGGPMLVDVKKVADIGRFQRHVEEFRYHVQNAMYVDGYRQLYGETPAFIFLAVDSAISAGRYRVQVIELDQEWVSAGHDLYRKNLQTYHECRTGNNWLGLTTLNRPRWA